MSSHLVLISHDKDDVAFWQHVARRIECEFVNPLTRDDVRRSLVAHPKSYVIWNAETETGYDSIGEVLPKYVKAQQVFAVTEKALHLYSHLLALPIFSHHIQRRYPTVAVELYGRLLQCAVTSSPFGMEKFFPRETGRKEIVIKRSTHKTAAINAIQNSLGKSGLTPRLAALVAQATDELILNALFDAPIFPDGTPLRKQMKKTADFELGPKEYIQVEVAQTNGYMGIAVTDQFGSLKKKVILESLRKHLEKVANPSKAGSTELSLGLHGLLNSGLSLFCVAKPNARTQMTLMFPQTENYRLFRSGFRFFSLLAD